ncbi:UDP-2,3-diacylglucosamine diphosphatase [uncultured Fluviicola sp.]|uniref:UDP-2,3-diacylglucosamine diphosphatase n=1 Tax=uncultured Fluviicola sp. TaxID=463303 RepID=UPI0025E44A64|nr:UDP-2,3-diacylglucosamine diphosphatase [uncultured Fluviicola sp.]
MEIPAGKKIYFASDFHLGVPVGKSSFEREKRIIDWLDHIRQDAFEIYLVGDIFDFWFEYKHAIPKGFVRIQGKIAELVDSGIPVYFFTGNHDMWMFDYFEKELGVKIYREPIHRNYNSKKFLIGHGDGLGPGDRGYKFIKKVFAAKWSQWMFARLHPNFGIALANYFSRKSRIATGDSDSKFLGEDNEWLVQYCKEQEGINPQDYYIFGHRHLPMTIRISERATYINLGEWIHYNTYAVFDGLETKLLEWK